MLKAYQKFYNFPYQIEPFTLYRIFLGLISFIYFSQIYQEVPFFFSPEGFFSNSSTPLWIGQIFLHSEITSYAVISLGIIASVAIIFNYFTNFMLFLCFLLICGLNDVDPSIVHGQDQVLRITLFWFSLLYEGTGKGIRKSIFTLWQVQISLIYLMSVFLKFKSQIWLDLDALQYVLQMDHTLTPIGKFMADLPLELKRYLTFSVMAIELAGALMVWVPHAKIKLWTCWLFIFFHITIWFSFELGVLTPLCIIWWLTLLPNQNLISSTHSGKDIIGRVKLIIAALALFIIFGISFNQLSKDFKLNLIHKISKYTFLYQSWGMFAPAEMINFSGWPVIIGRTKSEEAINLITNEPVSSESSPGYSEVYKTMHWRSFYRINMTYSQSRLENLIPGFYCKKNPDLSSIELTLMNKVMGTVNTSSPVYKRASYKYACSGL